MPSHKNPELFQGRRALSLDIKTWNEKSRTVDAVMATETPCPMHDFRMGCMVDEVLIMAGAKYPEQVPLLDTHDDSSIAKQIGSTRNIRIEGDKMVGTRCLATGSPLADAAAALISGGHLTDGSIHYRYTNPVYIDIGQTAVVNGRSYSAADRPMRIAMNWSLIDDSMCPIGADPNAKMRSKNENEPIPEAVATGEIKKEKHNMTPFETWLSARGHDPKALDEAKRAALQAEFDAEKVEPKRTAEPTITPEDVTRAAERARAEAVRYVQDVTSLCERHGVADMARKLIEANTSMADVNAAILARLESVRKPIDQTIEIQADECDKFRSACVDGILMSRNLKIQKPAEGAEQLSRIGFHALARMCADRMGLRASSMDTQNLMLAVMGKRSIGYTGSRSGFGMNSGDFTNILANVANKALMVGYNLGPQSWRAWCSKGDLPDFKSAKRVRLSDAPQIPIVNDGGELTFLKMTDSGETIALATRAANIGFTRQALINDDKSAIDAFKVLGNSVAQTTNSLPYAILIANANLADGGALFNDNAIPTAASPNLGGHKNLATGGDVGAPSAGNVSILEKKMLDQTSPAYNPMNLTPKFLLAGSAHKTNVQILLNSMALPVADMASGVFNPYATSNSGIIPIIDTNITGTKWYLACDPMVEPTVEVAFLNGVETPTLVETVDQTEILGTTYTCFYDVAAKALSYRGLAYNPGA